LKFFFINNLFHVFLWILIFQYNFLIIFDKFCYWTRSITLDLFENDCKILAFLIVIRTYFSSIVFFWALWFCLFLFFMEANVNNWNSLGERYFWSSLWITYFRTLSGRIFFVTRLLWRSFFSVTLGGLYCYRIFIILYDTGTYFFIYH
jgi:hypothetical protein